MTTHVTIKNHGPQHIDIAAVELVAGGEKNDDTRIMLVHHNLKPEEEVTLYLWQEHFLEVREVGNKGLTT